MLFAIDKSGKTVSASSAAARRARGYTCPCCRKPVILCAGLRNRAYFAHRAHVATPECENYHPGGEYTGGGRSAQVLRALSLYIALDNPYIGKSSWRLELLVPRSPDGIGRVFVHAGIGGTIPIYCSKLKDSGRRVPVRALTDSYPVTTDDATDADYRRRLTAATPGLDTDIANTFRYSDAGGRRLEFGSPLYWGRGYYLVWQRLLLPRWPKAIWHEEVGDHGTWKCARIELPADPDETVATWAAEFANRDVERPPIALSLLSPASAIRLEDDSIVLPADAEVLVGVTAEYGASMPDAVLVSSGAGVERISLAALKNQSVVIISLGSDLPLGPTTIAAEGEEDAGLSIEVRAFRPGNEVVGPTLHFVGEYGTETLPSYSTRAQAYLQNARSDTGALVGLTIPPRAGVRVSRRRRNSVWTDNYFRWDIERNVASRLYPQEFENDVLRAIVEALASADDVRVDFGNFGSLLVSAKVLRADSAHAPKLTDAIRHRLQWISMMPQHVSGITQTVPLPELAVAITTLLRAHVVGDEARKDQALFRRLVERKRWPRELVPHLRELVTTVSCLPAES